MSRIVYSRTAIRDLDRVWDDVYEVSRDAETATRYVSDFIEKIDTKALFAKSGSPLYFKDVFTGYYYVVFKSYMAFYRLEGDMMCIDRIIYGKRDYMRLLFGDIDE